MQTAPPVNYLGAIIFWSYNVAALGLTAIVAHTLASQQPPHDGIHERRRRLTGHFSALAAVSFSTLSFNMLNVLVQSYTQWSKRVPSSYDRNHRSTLNRIWTWSITSTLFRDFGEAIVADQARYLWVLSALFATYSVCSYMGVEGRRRKIPRLWAFFALSQILPISFAQNLFYIALIRQPRRDQPVDVRSLPSAVVLVVYSLGLSVATRSAQTPALVALIIVARLLLFAQFSLVKTGTGTTKHTASRRLQTPLIVAGLLTVRQTYLALQENSPTDIGMALVGHPAVSALGIDLINSALSFAAWSYSGQTGEDIPADSKKK
ncbi:hypothetical protein B0A55_07323 [Friedmanniomyces simplex]|uniref:Uncharacterized protein n=1 Tax=Friedmanniomyces simplex TaxID=329884 RepID=A0A4U0X899_9PEZI|nr:hypothetical protein B0A55_07323 [Friedmanniomyces simplex]